MSVGTVSESSGTPTGDIIQRGSDSNGEYVRYADGTQICTIESKGSSSSALSTWTFPAAFVSGTKPTVAGTSINAFNRICVPGNATAVSNTSWNFAAMFVDTASYSGTHSVGFSTSNHNLSAVGRWF